MKPRPQLLYPVVIVALLSVNLLQLYLSASCKCPSPAADAASACAVANANAHAASARAPSPAPAAGEDGGGDHFDDAAALVDAEGAPPAAAAAPPGAACAPGNGSAPDGWKLINVFVGKSRYGKREEWNSEAGQDQAIASIFRNKRGGYFVDLGAGHAVEGSNTLSLERDLNWTGLCIEANHDYLWGLAHRKCDVVFAAAWNETGPEIRFARRPGGAPATRGAVLSRAAGIRLGKRHPNGTRPVEERDGSLMAGLTLADALAYARAPSVIDYLSLDVAGAESVILEGFPFEKYIFLAITVESPKLSLVRILEKKGYICVKCVGLAGDKLLVHSTIPDLESVLRVARPS